VIKAERQMDAAACLNRATWEAVTRAGRSIDISITVRGWRDDDGELHGINLLHDVDAPALFVKGQFLSVSAEFTLDNNGPITVFRLAPIGAYEMMPPASRAKRIGTGAADTSGGLYD
jgi:prophage tail gpP-like protein